MHASLFSGTQLNHERVHPFPVSTLRREGSTREVPLPLFSFRPHSTPLLTPAPGEARSIRSGPVMKRTRHGVKGYSLRQSSQPKKFPPISRPLPSLLTCYTHK